MPTDVALRTRPQYAALLDWLRSYVAGDGELGEVDDSFVHAAVEQRVATLAVHCGARHPYLAEVERRDFVRGQQTLTGSIRAVGVLAEAGVPCVTLKGSAMAARFWGDVAMRPSGDVDLLVAPHDLMAAGAVLVADGCRRDDLYPDWYLRGWHYNLGYVAADRSLPKVELHWSFVRPYLGRPPIDEVVTTGVSVACGPRELPAPADHWQLIAACAHTAFHELQLRTLLDVAFVARSLDEPGWLLALAAARRSQLGVGLYHGVRVSADLLGWRPPAMLEELRPGPVRERVRERYVEGLTPFGQPGLPTRQLGKFATPLVSSDFPRVIAAMPLSLTDRPRVLSRLDAAARRLAGRLTDGRSR